MQWWYQYSITSSRQNVEIGNDVVSSRITSVKIHRSKMMNAFTALHTDTYPIAAGCYSGVMASNVRAWNCHKEKRCPVNHSRMVSSDRWTSKGMSRHWTPLSYGPRSKGSFWLISYSGKVTVVFIKSPLQPLVLFIPTVSKTVQRLNDNVAKTRPTSWSRTVCLLCYYFKRE